MVRCDNDGCCSSSGDFFGIPCGLDVESSQGTWNSILGLRDSCLVFRVGSLRQKIKFTLANPAPYYGWTTRGTQDLSGKKCDFLWILYEIYILSILLNLLPQPIYIWRLGVFNCRFINSFYYLKCKFPDSEISVFSWRILCSLIFLQFHFKSLWNQILREEEVVCRDRKVVAGI